MTARYPKRNLTSAFFITVRPTVCLGVEAVPVARRDRPAVLSNT